MPDKQPDAPAGFRRQTILKRTLLLLLLVLLASLLWPGRGPGQPLHVAAAKGGQPLDLSTITALALDENFAAAVALSDEQVAALLRGKAYDFVHAVRLGTEEARAWQDEGCGDRNCAHVTLYNYTDGGTVEAVVNLAEKEVLSRWAAEANRPGPSEHVLPRALDIAAGDAAVQQVLGDIRAAESVMVPMPIWLVDDDCANDWCVDLTYQDPAGSGRVYHVVVNMEQQVVARTFFSRARADRTFKRPAQSTFFDDGCHEQYGWSVCWEMTANDGINFSDATYNGNLIFSSVKIGQTEVWYPAWPGGYRDEIGFSASVPPHFGTLVNDLSDGFEVRQLFTEFLRWPNCICCYRYEQVLRFFADGTFEFAFVSHGPGCEDLSTYRPFWRLDIDLGGPDNDRLYYWEETQWVEATEELELSLFADLGPNGQKLATIDGDNGSISYRWQPIATDPLGLDEGKLFGLRFNEGEGDGPIVTGPGDTFRPPRQWLDGEPLSGENIVLWYTPFLKTKKGGPWWCMPDPDPNFTPCEAILRVVPAGELTQPTAEELAQLQATPTPAPTLQVTAAPTATPRAIEGEDPEGVIGAAGCTACHRIGNLGEAGKVGPDLTEIGLTAGSRVPGLSAEGYIHQSIVDPNLVIAPECPNGACLPNIMPQDYATRLTPAQIEAVVGYLLALSAPAGAENTPPATAPPAGDNTPTPPATATAATIGAAVSPLPSPSPTPLRVPTSAPISGDTSTAIYLMIFGILVVFGLAILTRRR
ncbi:MAG: c-type cytochrome [Ardenticatenaceae bacterium]|nr:c-type cytochrome [Ardenticatenaceae bacterium]